MENMIDFYDIYDYYEIPFWQTTWFKVTILITLALLVIGLLFFLFLRKKRKTVAPWEWAQHQLAGLSPEKYTRKDEYKKFYFQLTTIVKKYLKKRYGWNIEDKTDQELVAWLETQECDQIIITGLKKIGEGALEIKFANVEALRSQAESDRQTIIMIIEKTIPVKP